MSQNLNLIQKLAKVRSVSDAVMKDKKGYGYTYADINEILAKVTAEMAKNEVSLIPIVTPETAKVEVVTTTNTKVTKDGTPYDNTNTEMLVTGDMVFRWVNDADPSEHLDVPWFVVGAQSDPSQAFGSGLTYCTRYFLTNFFQIAQVETDVDEYRSKQKEAAETEERAIADSIIKEFDTMLRMYLADNQEKKEEVSAFISRYAKKSDYTKIKEPKLAAKLVSDFRAEFMKEEEEN